VGTLTDFNDFWSEDRDRSGRKGRKGRSSGSQARRGSDPAGTGDGQVHELRPRPAGAAPRPGSPGPGKHPPGKGPKRQPHRRSRRGRVSIAIGLVVLAATTAATVGLTDLVVRDASRTEQIHFRRRSRALWRDWESQSLDGSGNNRRNPSWGIAGANYLRVAPADYADGRSAPQPGPSSRFVSNRVFNDIHQNVFSEGGVTQWGFVWGQFVDHTIGLRDEAGEPQNLPFDAADPLEEFENTLGHIPFTRSAAAPGTGVSNPREQVNTESSFIDAEAVYGHDEERLEWLREGPVDGDLSNNGAKLRLDESGLLPRRDALGDASTAPEMAIDGRLMGQEGRAMVAGDKRANENIALTATQTLFAREHNRIVDELPASLTEEQKFQVARRVVIAEQQFITYNEFLPAMGVRLPRYRGYNGRINPTLGNEFATVGYRAHSQIHGEIEVETDADRYDAAAFAALEQQGVEVEPSEDGAEVALVVPLNVGFFNPDLVGQLQLGPLLQGIGLESQYKNDEMMDNQLRSVLFQIPDPGNPGCLDGEGLPECFQGVVDLGALDIERGRDHGMPSYNDLREAYGLERKTSFTDITGEDTDEFPEDPALTAGDEVNDPDSLTFTGLSNRAGDDIDLASPEAETDAVGAVRRTTTAARLRAIYGDVDEVDAFTGMVAEAHTDGSDLGELQRAIWARQFLALRDGDRFFYGNDRDLRRIRQLYGIDYRTNLGDVIARNTDIPREEMAANVFEVQEEAPPGDQVAAAPAG
jgi:hypothetical protein